MLGWGIDCSVLITFRPTLRTSYFFHGRCSPRWTSTSFSNARHWSRSCDFRLQFLTPVIFRSSPAESSHPMAGLPTRRASSGVCRVDFLQRFCSCILNRCPNHLNRPTSITVTVSGSGYVMWRTDPFLGKDLKLITSTAVAMQKRINGRF
jgi:hypothetical protein